MIWLLIALTIVAVLECRAVALRKGRNPAAFIVTALFLPIVSLAAVAITPSSKERGQARVWTPALMVGALVIVGLTAVLAGGFFVSAAKASHQATIDSILADDARTSNLSVDYLQLPFGAAVPLLNQSAYKGYFTVKRGDDAPLGACEWVTFDFSGRKVKDEQYSLIIDAETMERLSSCN